MQPRSLRFAALQRTSERVGYVIAERCRALAFWLSVCLPFAYAPVVLMPEVESVLVVPLAMIHGCALVLGHSHGHRTDEDPTAVRDPGGTT